jgi:hypothetical protein
MVKRLSMEPFEGLVVFRQVAIVWKLVVRNLTHSSWLKSEAPTAHRARACANGIRSSRRGASRQSINTRAQTSFVAARIGWPRSSVG